MTQITASARAQLHASIAFFLDPARSWIEAAENLNASYLDAVEVIGEAPGEGLRHPPRHARLARYGFLWRKFGNYWFSFVPKGPDGHPVITNIVNQKILDGTISRDEEPVFDA